MLSFDDYFFNHFLHHAVAAQLYAEILALIDGNWLVEGEAFLVAKANHLGTFSHISDDIENYAMPCAIQLEDWSHFVSCAVTAINLRGLAEGLADGAILQALLDYDQDKLVEDIAKQLSTPLDRAWVKANLLHNASRFPVKHKELLQDILSELSHVEIHDSESKATRLFETIFLMVDNIEPSFQTEFAILVEKLVEWPQYQSQIWLNHVRVRLQHGHPIQDVFPVLKKVKDKNALVRELPILIAATQLDSLLAFLTQYKIYVGDTADDLFWWTLVATLNRLSIINPHTAWGHWQSITVALQVPWSQYLVEVGNDFFGTLDPAVLSSYISVIVDPVSRLALFVAACEHDNYFTDWRSITQVLEEIPLGTNYLHWALKVIETNAHKPNINLDSLLLAVRTYVFRTNYYLSPISACRYLNLVALLEPTVVLQEIEHVIQAQHTNSQFLMEMAVQIKNEKLLTLLFNRVELYTSQITINEAEGFEIRKQVIIKIAEHLCLKEMSLKPLSNAVPRLLPHERDELHSTISLRLAEIGSLSLAEEAWREIQDKKLSFKTRLRIVAKKNGEQDERKDLNVLSLLQFTTLYHAFVSVSDIEDERLALTALSEKPNFPNQLAEKYLTQIASQDRQNIALTDLAQHNYISQQDLEKNQKNHTVALKLIQQAARAIRSEDQLLAAMPQIASLATTMREEFSLAEYFESIKCIVMWTKIPWERRFETLLIMFGQIHRIVCDDPPGSMQRYHVVCQTTASFYRSLLELPNHPDIAETLYEVQENWHILFTLIVASVERMPPLVNEYFKHPIRTVLSDEWLSHVRMIIGRDRLLGILVGVEQRLITYFALQQFGFNPDIIKRWPWLSEFQAEIIKYSFKTKQDRIRLALQETASNNPVHLLALAILTANDYPTLVPKLIEKMENGNIRDVFCVGLLDGNWVPRWTMDLFVPLISREFWRLYIQARWSTHKVDWDPKYDLESIVEELISSPGFDPGHFRMRELTHELWKKADFLSLVSIARCVTHRLLIDGKQGGEASLKSWLGIYIRPSLGMPKDDGNPKSIAIEKSIRRALSLSAQGPSFPSRPVISSKKEGETIKNIYQRWRSTQARFYWRLSKTPSKSFKDTGVLVMIAWSIPLMIVDWSIFLRNGVDTKAISNLSSLSHTLLWAGALLLFGVNAGMIDQYAHLLTPNPEIYKGWLKKVRFLFSGIPVFGLYALNTWQWILERQPQWTIKPIDRSPKLNIGVWPKWVGKLAIQLFRERVRFSWVARQAWFKVSAWWLLMVNVIFLLFWANQVPGIIAGSADNRTEMNVLVTCLHVLVAIAIAYTLHVEAKQARASTLGHTGRVALMLFWLIPFYPGLSLVGMLLYGFLPKPKEEETIIHQAYQSRGAVYQLPLWIKMEEVLQNRWESLPWWARMKETTGKTLDTNSSTESEKWIHWVYKFKSIALVGEAAGLAWGLGWISAQVSILENGIDFLLSALVYGSLFIGAIGILLMVIRFFQYATTTARKYNWMEEHGYARYITNTQLAFAMGLLLGSGLWLGDNDIVGGTLIIAAILGAVGIGLPMLLGVIVKVYDDQNRDLRETVLWILLWGAFFYLGQSILAKDSNYENSLLQIRIYLILFVAGDLPSIALHPRLLKPMTARQIFSRVLPNPMRLVSALIFLTIILPFGGLFIPVWIYMHHQVWSKFQQSSFQLE